MILYWIFFVGTILIPTFVTLASYGYCVFVVGEFKSKNNNDNNIPNLLFMLISRLFLIGMSLLMNYMNLFDNFEFKLSIALITPISWSFFIVVDSFITIRELTVIYKHHEAYDSNETNKLRRKRMLLDIRKLLKRFNKLLCLRNKIIPVMLISIVLEFIFLGYFTPLQLLFGIYIYLEYRIYNHILEK